MKTLILLRHAKSSWEDGDLVDFERHLNLRGRTAARRVGRSVRALGPEFDAVVISPAARSVETWEGFVQGYGPAPEPKLEPTIYLAAVETLFDLVRSTDDSIERLLVVGHNPGLERLALLLSRGDDGKRARLAEKYPTGALVEIDLPVDRWRDAAVSTGIIRRFVTPQDLDRHGGD